MFYYNLLNDILNDEYYPLNKVEENCDAILSGMLRTNIKENENGYIYEIEVPGFQKENIEINLNNGILKINAKNYFDEKNDKYILSERMSGEFSRSFKVDKLLKAEQISASFENGILKIELPKIAEENKSTKIEIK